jgi:hypothetical protein
MKVIVFVNVVPVINGIIIFSEYAPAATLKVTGPLTPNVVRSFIASAKVT